MTPAATDLTIGDGLVGQGVAFSPEYYAMVTVSKEKDTALLLYNKKTKKQFVLGDFGKHDSGQVGHANDVSFLTATTQNEKYLAVAHMKIGGIVPVIKIIGETGACVVSQFKLVDSQGAILPIGVTSTEVIGNELWVSGAYSGVKVLGGMDHLIQKISIQTKILY